MSEQAVSDYTGPTRDDLEADLLFDQHVFKTISYSLAGLTIGLVSAPFFRFKRFPVFFIAGMGAGLGMYNFRKDLILYDDYVKAATLTKLR